MTQIVGKTVYVLGAGCSHHTGAPLLGDFLVKARILMEGERDLIYKDSYERIFKWIDELRSASYYVEIDLDNLEHIFSLADMLRQIGTDEGKQYFSDLRYLVMETLDRCQIRWTRNTYNPDDLYSQFIKNLQELNKQRKNFIGQGTGPFEEDVIITFNYDVMLDYAMEFNSIIPNYCLPISPSSGKFKLLKLHGSLNWAKCKSCEHLQIVPASPIPAGYFPLPFGKNGAQINFKMVTHVLKNTKCEECHKEDTLEPIIIPPTWSKAIENSPLIKVWETAVEEIKNAFQLIVIGYSMPPTDTFFQYLLTLGLFSNAKLHRVVVVNKDNSEDLKGRYKKVFSRSLQERGQLKFLNNKSLRKRGGQIPADEVDFRQFIGSYMRKIGSEVEWSYE